MLEIYLKKLKFLINLKKELYDRIVKLKENEEQSENNSYRNTIQKVNKKEGYPNLDDIDYLK